MTPTTLFCVMSALCIVGSLAADGLAAVQLAVISTTLAALGVAAKGSR